MDVRKLVEIVESALGRDVSAERVEAIAAGIADRWPEVTGRPPIDASADSERVLITAFGHDRAGILAAVTSVVSEAGCNILDVSQKILQGYFTLIMLADVESDGGIRQLQDRLSQVEQQLGVRVIVQHEALFNAMHRP